MEYTQTFLFFFLPSITIFFIFLHFYSTSSKKKLPASPWKLPIIGNLHQLGSTPHRSLHSLSEKHGPLMLLCLGGKPTLVASSNEAARAIMKTHDLSFSSRPKFTIPNILFYGSKNIAFSPYGEHWRRLKSIVVVHLLSNTRVKSYRQVREEEIELMIGELHDSHGSSVDLGELIVSLTSNVICRVAFGRTDHGSHFTNLLRKLLDVLCVFNVGSYISWLSWVDRVNGLESRAKIIARECDEFLEGVVQEHVKRRSVESERDENEDLIDILLDFQRDNTRTAGFTLHTDSVKAIILETFAGGTDTIFASLEWAMSEIIRHPRVTKKLQQELTTIAQGRPTILENDLEKAQYLKAVIKESLRLHTPIPLLLPRESTQDVKLMGYDVPSGMQVIINAWAIGRDPALWEDPREFRPERFLDGSVSNLEYKGFDYEWLPFGGGRRGCPGLQFAAAVMELAIANIVYKFDLALPDGTRNEDLDMREVYGSTVTRKSPLLVTANPRF